MIKNKSVKKMLSKSSNNIDPPHPLALFYLILGGNFFEREVCNSLKRTYLEVGGGGGGTCKTNRNEQGRGGGAGGGGFKEGKFRANVLFE